MIKLIKFIIILLAVTTLASCTNSDENSTIETQNNKVVSKITVKFLNINDKNEEIIVTENLVYSYKEGKIYTITNSKNNFTKFNYNNNLLSSITNSTDTPENDNSIMNEYSEDQLSKSISEEQVSEFYYDSNTKLSEVLTKYIGSEKKYSTKFYYSGNNIIATISDRFWDTTPEVVTYKYDNKNNPFKNQDIYFRMLGLQVAILSENNVIEEQRENQIINYDIIYDDYNFPIKITGIVKETGKLWVEQTFEYTKI